LNDAPKSAIERVREQLKSENLASRYEGSPATLQRSETRFGTTPTPQNPMVVGAPSSDVDLATSGPFATTLSDQAPSALANGALPNSFENSGTHPQLFGAQSPALSVQRPAAPNPFSEIRQASANVQMPHGQTKANAKARKPAPIDMSWWLGTAKKSQGEQQTHPSSAPRWIGATQPSKLQPSSEEKATIVKP